ncbi:hypothetical protein GOZ90_09660 [Agrobacterium vitis]|uniref:Uncharacterized protein n=1 Tax=Agrobacterium vitis TaxID=373 RepID=A0A6L6VDT6_AGRVI|nr:hypothetical protein [Agrobacterium vitis]MUZ72948.1 hypothetical protein [Agrobacterium vitis]
MSAVVSIETPSAVFIITDGAVYNRDNILTRVERKVDVSDRVPVAVATRGGREIGKYAASKIIGAVEEFGFDAAMSWLGGQLHKFADNDPASKFEATIAGISETHGPRRLAFRSDAEPVALEHHGLACTFATSDAGLTDMGLRLRYQFEGWESYLRDIAVPMMEFYRRAPIAGSAGEVFDTPAHLVGGQVDLTIVTSKGVTVETIHRWDDKIDQRIEPFSERRTIQTFPGMSRQQRRAAERAKRMSA